MRGDIEICASVFNSERVPYAIYERRGDVYKKVCHFFFFLMHKIIYGNVLCFSVHELFFAQIIYGKLLANFFCYCTNYLWKFAKFCAAFFFFFNSFSLGSRSSKKLNSWNISEAPTPAKGTAADPCKPHTSPATQPLLPVCVL